MKKTLSVILALLLLLSASTLFASAEGEAVNGANWMSTIDGSVPITAINMPGTHDSMTQYIPASVIARTQTMSVLQQLYSGVRYLDIRAKINGGNVIGIHSVTNCKESYGLFSKDLLVKSVVEDCIRFLSENRGETVLFLFRAENTKDEQALFSKFYEECIAPFEESWFLFNRAPSLEEVRGKIVLLRVAKMDETSFDDSNSGINFEKYPHIGSTAMYDYRLCTISRLGNFDYMFMCVQDSYKLEGDKKIEVIKKFLESNLDSNDFNICCTNAAATKPAKANAQKINAFLMSYDFAAGKTYGIISMDFVTKELCEKIYMTNSPVMTEEASETQIPVFSESYGFMGKFFEFFRDLILDMILMLTK